MRVVRVATCNLNQWAMDFETNLANIKTSIQIAKQRRCTFRTGPELEITGYGCEDHFLEQDLFQHCWESLLEILDSDLTDGIICDIGMPVYHRGIRLNCRMFLLNRRILLIRPKMALASGGNYREERWFAAWDPELGLEEFQLPESVRSITGQTHVPIGVAILQANDARIASEICEELFCPDSPNIQLGLSGAEIFANGSGSHHSFRKLEQRLRLIREATARGGGIYLYANQQGCDGGRLYYDGCASVAVNGELVAQGSQFSLNDIEVITATVDLDDVLTYRGQIVSRGARAVRITPVPSVPVDFHLASSVSRPAILSQAIVPRVHPVEEEIAFGPACWLWDYLRRSGAAGFLLPLSGGADSSAAAAVVGSMCTLVARAAEAGNAQVIADSRRVAGEPQDSEYLPTDPKEFCRRILHTCYMGTANSSEETRQRARDLASEVGSFHWSVNIDTLVEAIVTVFEGMFGRRPRFAVYGGTPAENLALQNIQARLRMVLAYMCAQLLPWIRRKQGFLLVLGSGNVDEALRGYLTKYDCSSADINPIGGISKTDLKRFLLWAADHLGYESLKGVVAAQPSAELVPPSNGRIQSDEEDMGMTYEELSLFGRLRNVARCGPVAMYQKLRGIWTELSPMETAAKVKHFFTSYSINRHKVTTLTPSYHAESYSPDDNRYDLRQFLYNVRWPRQFRVIDELVQEDEAKAD